MPYRKLGCGSTAPTPAAIENLDGWLTTVVARVCLDMLRSRKSRREESVSSHMPDPIVSREGIDPENQALLADSVGLALLVVLETLAPVERLAFVLHDMFAVPFDEIAPHCGAFPSCNKAARESRTPPSPGSDLGPRLRPLPTARSCRCLRRCLPWR